MWATKGKTSHSKSPANIRYTEKLIQDVFKRVSKARHRSYLSYFTSQVLRNKT